MTVTELIEKLEVLDVNRDADVVIFNDGSCYEWYGVEKLGRCALVAKPKCVYILFANFNDTDSVPYDQEIEEVEKHYEENYEKD